MGRLGTGSHWAKVTFWVGMISLNFPAVGRDVVPTSWPGLCPWLSHSLQALGSPHLCFLLSRMKRPEKIHHGARAQLHDSRGTAYTQGHNVGGASECRSTGHNPTANKNYQQRWNQNTLIRYQCQNTFPYKVKLPDSHNVSRNSTI